MKCFCGMESLHRMGIASHAREVEARESALSQRSISALRLSKPVLVSKRIGANKQKPNYHLAPKGLHGSLWTAYDVFSGVLETLLMGALTASL